MKLTNKQKIMLALFDNNFQVGVDLENALAAAKAELNNWVADAFNYGGLLFDPVVEVPKIVDAVLAARLDTCLYCGADCTDLRIGHNCHQCGGN